MRKFTFAFGFTLDILQENNKLKEIWKYLDQHFGVNSVKHLGAKIWGHICEPKPPKPKPTCWRHFLFAFSFCNSEGSLWQVVYPLNAFAYQVRFKLQNLFVQITKCVFYKLQKIFVLFQLWVVAYYKVDRWYFNISLLAYYYCTYCIFDSNISSTLATTHIPSFVQIWKEMLR